MKDKLDSLPRYSTEDTEIDSKLYNEVRLAILRLERSIRFPLPGLRHLDMLLDEETWICLDNSLNDIPVFAWTDFRTTHRDSLHEPIACKLYTYHQHADKIVEQVKASIHEIIDARLHSDINTHEQNDH